MKLRPISLILPFVLFAVSSSLGQLIGSSENGQSTPKEVKSSEITSGGISADVNLFTGTLNASYSLGTVSTPTGLSFEVTSSYNSTFATGDNLPHLSGIPYGEGWEINLPTISVSVDDYNKYTLEEKNWIIRSFGQRHETFVGNEVDNEGKLFWFSPMLSIPGVASGRMVYKYSRNGKHYFVLRKFERYIEATFSGQYWEVVIDDGTRYEFGPMGVSHRNAINQRIHPTQPSYPYYDDYDVKHLMLPQTEYLTWHCMNIRNSDLIGNIDFTYYAYGAMDFYSAYKQPALDFCLGSEWGENATLKTVYRDIFIKEINSGYERMQFTYTSIPLSGSADLLDVNAPDVEPVDDLYSKKTVYETDGNSLLSGWRRYKHVKSDGLSSSTFNLAVPTNPYLAVSNTIPSSGGCNNAEGLYITEPLGSQDNSFSHGFLESPRLVPTGDNVDNPPGWNSQQVSMPPGEVYEISARIQKGGSRECLFDVNLATGDYSSGLVTPAGHPDYPINCSYMTTRGQTVFSTFNQGIKWHSKGNYPEDLVDISNYFVMPNLPRAFRGFNIQIGPANSDNNFALNPDEIEYQNDVTRPDICKSYINTPYLGQIALTDPDLGTGDEIAPELLYYTGSTPSNFGIGLPWHIMLGFYRCVSPAMDWCFNTTGSGSSPFWWNDQQTYGTAHPWDNEPTLADQDTRLNNVKIVRYGKNPLMLTHVKKQLLNPGESLPENNDPNAIWHTVLNYKLEYEIETTPHYVNYYNTATQSQQFEPSGYQRNMVKLMRIRQLPNDAGDGSGISDFATIPTTHFEYSTKVSTAQTYEPPEPFFLLGPNSVVPVYNINANYILLTKITDPLGKETVIEYKPYDAGSYKSFKYLRQSSPKDWQHTYPYFGQIRTAQNVAFQVYMTVHSKTVTERRGNKVWTYAFNNLRTLDTEIPINDNFRWDKNYSLEFGYETAVVSGTNGPDGSPVSTYSHHTDRLLWGKLSGVEVRDGSGSLVSSNSYSYEAVLAFEPPFIRTAKSVDDTDDNQDYGEYIHLSGRPLPENYSNPIDYITAILAFIEGLNEEYQTAISALTAPGSAPAGQCPTGNGTVSCGCADYEFMDAASKAACDAYWSSWQTYLNQLAQISQEYNQFFSSGDEIPNMSTQTGVYAVPKFYEAIFFRYIINEDPLFLNSYFIKKTAETSTVYDNKCDSQASEQVQTITTYEYFDADYKGTKLSGGFAKMGIEDQVIGGQSYNRLYWEPSWQLYKTTTTSPQLPGFENTEEYFYLYDLINHPYYIRPDDKKTKSTYQMLTLLFTVKKKRDFIFEKRTTRKVYNQQPIVQSEYYIYDKNWEAQLPPQEIVEVDNPYEETGPCVDNSYGNNGGNPFVILPCVLATQGQNLEGYCSYTENIYCPCEIVDDMEPTGGNIIGDDDIMGYVSNSIEGKYFLRQIYVQVRDNTPPVLRFEDDLNNPEFQTDVLSTYYVHSRNGLGQVLLEEDEKQLKTKYDYGITKILVYETCINGILREQYQVLNPNFRAPKSVTIGESLPNSLTTHFTYHPDYTIQSVTDPNGMVLTYDYDGYQRMIKAYRNGVAIQEAAYYNWQNDFGLNFKQRALQNHVDILNLLEDDKGFGTKNFLDPIGRKSGSVSHSTHDGNVVVEDHFFDLYDRPFSSHQPTLGSAPHIALDSENDELSCNHNNMDYDVAPRSNVLQAAKFGLCLNGGHSVNSSYCIATYAQLKNELDHTGQPNVDDILVPGSSYFRTETADEDNKTIIEYTNAIGQKIASITGNGNAATIFTYDAHGRASLVVNAEKQQMTYNCNYLGQVHKKYTPDAGITQIAYNQSGQVILEVDTSPGELLTTKPAPSARQHTLTAIVLAITG